MTLPALFVWEGINAKLSRGIEINTALSLALEMCTSNIVSDLFPAAVATDPTLNSFSSALERPSLVSDPTNK